MVAGCAFDCFKIWYSVNVLASNFFMLYSPAKHIKVSSAGHLLKDLVWKCATAMYTVPVAGLIVYSL